ncbi:hypothetical protein RF11_10757 [Thelohanellus kitauei]|uniref:Uncharacterized protein n=1 Tax=Thelohanellus kitauei TaxID=669202 RepID=A0A0C2MD03_THEKT|nr:hypothetical protein RF11_10757 [Thelohanellus kitauei]
MGVDLPMFTERSFVYMDSSLDQKDLECKNQNSPKVLVLFDFKMYRKMYQQIKDIKKPKPRKQVNKFPKTIAQVVELTETATLRDHIDNIPLKSEKEDTIKMRVEVRSRVSRRNTFIETENDIEPPKLMAKVDEKGEIMPEE